MRYEDALLLESDPIVRAILDPAPFGITITESIFNYCAKKAKEYGRGHTERSDEQKLADSLMTCVEDRLESLGAPKSKNKYKDNVLHHLSERIFGELELKTYNTKNGPLSVSTWQNFDFLLAYERVGFTSYSLAKRIESMDDPCEIIGTVLTFRLGGVIEKSHPDRLYIEYEHRKAVETKDEPSEEAAYS